MTMLDRMRRHRNWLKWSLALVCLAFVIFYIPDFLMTQGQTTDLTGTNTVAVVNGHEIRGDEFQRTYQAQLAAYRQAYGANMNEQLLRQLGVDQQILQQMVDERASLAEAERVGIRVGDHEVRQRILSIPAFQENGAFIGEQRYVQLLAAQRPPMTPAEFEETLRRALVVEKLRAAITEWVSIPDTELDQEYRRRNDKVKLAVVTLRADSFRSDVSATDAEISSHFDAHKDDFKIPEKRKIRYLLIDIDAIRAKIVVSPAEVEAAYNENIDQYSTPEQVRASHILLKTEGKDEAAVKAQAEDILKQARTTGADFAALAKKYSQDEATAPNGGDLDLFGRGRMVPEFDAAVFSMQPGTISDLVKTPFGFHVIKLLEKKGGVSKTLDEVRQHISEQIGFERAQNQATDLARRLEQQIKKPSDLDTVGKAQGLTPQESGFFAREEPILGLGASPEAAAKAFEMTQDQVSGALRTGRGYVIETVVGRQDSYLPKLDEVKEKVRDEILRTKAKDVARKKADELAPKLRAATDFEKAAKAAGFEAKTTELIARDSPIPDVGVAPAVIESAFKLASGAVSEPIPTDTGVAIVKVVEKQEVTDTELVSNRDQFREDLLTDRRNRFFSAYMTKAKQKMKIDVNREVVQRLLG